jgi:transcriptional regulator with XRE-family HTH domain
MSVSVINQQGKVYNYAVRTGRPTKQKRSPFGEQLYQARNSAGISQAQAAEELNVSQSGYAAWERGRSSPSPEQIEQLSKLFKVTIASLFVEEKNSIRGPVGRTRKAFEEVSKLPRHAQQRITSVVEELLIAHKAK